MTQDPPKDYDAAAQWAENDMQLDPHSETALRGPAASAAGSALLEAAMGGPEAVAKAVGGRPALTPAAERGEHSRKINVRLGHDLDRRLTKAADAGPLSASEIIRAALDQYLPPAPAGGSSSARVS